MKSVTMEITVYIAPDGTRFGTKAAYTTHYNARYGKPIKTVTTPDGTIVSVHKEPNENKLFVLVRKPDGEEYEKPWGEVISTFFGMYSVV